MLGKRLKKANAIAKRRYNRYEWYPSVDGWVGLYGHYRKFNGACGCRMCRLNRPKHKQKGFRKRQSQELNGHELHGNRRNTR